MAEVSPAAERPTVLVVDDEEDLRDIIRRILERRGFDTLVAADSEQAMAACADPTTDIDVMVTDLTLPDIPGGELARAALGLRPELGVVFISGLPKDIAVDQGKIDQDALLVKKPFSADALTDAVRTVLEKRPPA